MAVVFPIAPGKTEDWRKFIGELNGSRFEDFKASREGVGLHERTFLQSTPMGDLVIVTLEGDDPMASFGRLTQADDEFSKWFLAQASEVHGFDMAVPPEGPLPELVADSERAVVTA
jgi:hypothetical protein